jgi:diguanylate cyclase (GGDEF)-like protein/PAS domain S-box-containing protein
LSPAAEVELNALPVACARIDRVGRVTEANSHWRALFRLDEAGSEGQVLTDWCAQLEDGPLRLTEAAERRHTLRLEVRLPDGVPITVAFDLVEERDSGPLLCTAREIGGADLLSESQRYLDVAFELAPIGMALFDTQGRYVRVNDSLCRLLRRSRQELLGRRDQEFTHPDDRQSDVDAAWRILRGELDSWQTEKRFLTPDGRTLWVIANLVFLRDDEGRPLSWLGQFQDITARRSREDVLGHIATHDDLTEIANRRGLIAKLNDSLAFARRYQQSGAVLILDLDGFKEVNDRAGHQAGDALLVQTARALRTRLRITDFLARMGGDEFAVVLPHADSGAAHVVAQELLLALGDLAETELSFSCGIALYGPETPDVETVLARGDRAMYAAKARGRGQIVADGAAG